MSRQVMVTNNDSNEYKEMFQGRLIILPPGGSINMKATEAAHFLGKRPLGNIVKKLGTSAVAQETPHIVAEHTCDVCGKSSKTKAGLVSHKRKHTYEKKEL